MALGILALTACQVLARFVHVATRRLAIRRIPPLAHSLLYRHATHRELRPIRRRLRLAVRVAGMDERAVARAIVGRRAGHGLHEVRDVGVHRTDLRGVAGLGAPSALAPRSRATRPWLAFAR